MRLVTLLSVWLSYTLILHGQQPWDCSGRIFRVVEKDGGTELQELFVQKMTGTVASNPLAFYPGLRINGIAYHPQQNMIYGVLLGNPYQLCRIDAEKNLEVLCTLPFPEDYLFVSGDMAPDEKHLILLGYSEQDVPNLLAKIDLSDPTFPTELIPTITTGPQATHIYCADIAYHPTTGQLFGFDHLQNRLITIDPQLGLIDNTTYPVSHTAEGNLPSLFFTPQGELFGIGSLNVGYAVDRYFFQVNTQTGDLIPWNNLGYEANQDACACPFDIHLSNRISQRHVALCTSVQFTLTLINRTDRILEPVRILDTFPPGTTIVSVSPLPFEGELVQGPGGRLLEISKASIPIGRDSFYITIHVDRQAQTGQQFNQAWMTSPKMESGILPSDDPQTLQWNDATAFEIKGMEVKFGDLPYQLCDGDSIAIQPEIMNGDAYRWSSGDTSRILWVHHPGDYQLTVTSGCDQQSGTAVVQSTSIDVDLGADRVIDRGETYVLKPEITSVFPITSIHWESTHPESMTCSSCEVAQINPWTDTEYQVSIRNSAGCTQEDKVMIRVRDLSYFVPNVFSPNNDLNNDLFYLQGPGNYLIESFMVYDRWGTILYEIRDGQSNDPAFGWDGTSNSKPVPAGVYSWQAKMLTKNGKEVWAFGDVTLVR